MKKINKLIFALFISLLLLPFYSCEVSDPETDPITGDPTEEEEKPDEEEPLSGTYAENGFDDQASMDFATYVLREVNYARTDPDGYAEERLLSDYNSSTDKGAYLDLKNNYSAGSTLVLNAKLNAAADKYAKVMGDEDIFEHGDVQGRIEAEGYDWSTYGENIALRGGPDADATVDADKAAVAFVVQWIISPGHRTNIMRDSFTEIGVGYYKVDGGSYDTHYAVQNFGAPR